MKLKIVKRVFTFFLTEKFLHKLTDLLWLKNKTLKWSFSGNLATYLHRNRERIDCLQTFFGATRLPLRRYKTHRAKSVLGLTEESESKELFCSQCIEFDCAPFVETVDSSRKHERICIHSTYAREIGLKSETSSC